MYNGNYSPDNSRQWPYRNYSKENSRPWPSGVSSFSVSLSTEDIAVTERGRHRRNREAKSLRVDTKPVKKCLSTDGLRHALLRGGLLFGFGDHKICPCN
ncbi:hypothetical protein AMTR_s00070p00069560 [Amborella trichopoda]|uniref:Uncharacterized protein n=1 Tax=Amborella trichopoda TaxID=13333 RepID=U5DJ22_AMBTC|nr:hypothetical protein AMTR_s00070p00069560 [Amborella trichopoda]